MTLKTNLHSLFNNLALWFEAAVGHILIVLSPHKYVFYHQGTVNHYKVCLGTETACSSLRIPEHVEFRTERQDLPLPSPRYLEIHRAVCRVAHMAGAAGYHHYLEDDDDPHATKFRCFDPVESDFPAALHTRLLDLSEQRAVFAISG